MLFTQAVEKFINNLKITNKSQETITGYSKELKYFIIFWEDKYNYPPQLEDIDDSHIDEYLQYKKDKNMASSSIDRALHIISSFYKFLCKKRICSTNPAFYVDSIKVVKSRREFLTCEEFQKLLENTNSELMKVIFFTLYNSGLRISELINLKIEDVDLENKIIHVLGKGSKFRDIPINDKLYNVLTKYLKTRKSNSNYFFVTNRTGKISAQYINRCLGEAVDKAEINKHITCHSIRHSFSSNLLEHGATIEEVRELLGHANIRTTSIYLHSIPGNLRTAVNLL